MCDAADDSAGTVYVTAESGKRPPNVQVADIRDLMTNARAVAELPERRTTHVGFVGYGSTVSGHKVLIAVDREYDPAVPHAIAQALREKGARVDLLTVDLGSAEREFDELDEVRVTMRRGPWHENPRRWEGLPFVEEFARWHGYDLLIHGKGGPIPKTDYRYEAIPWLQMEHFLSSATVFPQDLHLLINDKAWAPIWNVPGGRAHLTDPEGTDVSWSYWPEYYDGTHYGFLAEPRHGHLFGHPTPPIIAREDAAGVVMGTTSHFTRAFPRIAVQLDAGQIVKVEGGGRYGDAWRDLLEESKRIHYPCFPRPGLFYLWEVAIGTNPKISRPRNMERHSSGGFEWERRRSGIIHMGFGTFWRGPEEEWAGERGLLYGHLHIHLLRPTLVVREKNGAEHAIIRDGRLTALDDPEVRRLAAKYGDPDEILREDWIPRIPGITCPGSYEEFAKDPAAWIYGERSQPR